MPQRHLFGHGMGVVLIFGLMVLYLSGCTHLHNPEKATLARNTSEEFKKFQTNSAQVYQAMLDNLQKEEAKVAQRRKELSQEKELSFASQAHAMKWGKILNDLEALKKKKAEINAKVTAAVIKLIEERKGAATHVANATEALKKANDLLKKAVEEQNRWEARKMLFRGALQLAAETSAAAKNQKLGPDMIIGGLKKVLDQKITTVAVGANGQLTSPESTVGKVIRDELITPDRLDLSEVLSRTGSQFDPSKAPGLTVVILSLAVDLADAKLQKSRLETAYLSNRINALQSLKEAYDFLEPSEKLMAAFIREGTLLPEEIVLTSLNRFRRKGQPDNLAAATQALYLFGITKVLDESEQARLAAQPSILDHAYSINLSALHGREHEALISRGLQGLQMYHEGGVKPENIANFLRAAQTVAMAVISAQVN